MILIKPSVKSYDEVTLDTRPLLVRTISSIMGRQPKLSNFVGRAEWSSALIEFPQAVSMERHVGPVVFGNNLYHGIIPFEQESKNTYWCYVSYVEPVLHGTIKE